MVMTKAEAVQKGDKVADGVLQTWLRAQADTDAGPGSGRAYGEGPAAQRDLTLPAPRPPTLERAVGLALGRAASGSGLSATVEDVEAQGLSLAEMIETLPESGLIALVEGPTDALGMVALCPLMVASLVEIEATGRLGTATPEPRRPTRTDATIAAVFVNHAMDEIAALTATLPSGACWTGYRYASHLADPRPLSLMLEDIGYRSVSLRLRMGSDGRRVGSVTIALPGPEAVNREVTVPPIDNVAPLQQSEAIARPPGITTLAAAVAAAPITLRAVLARRTVTLRELRGLQPGSTLALPSPALSGVLLETRTGQLLARGRLGEQDGFYALRLFDLDAMADDEGTHLPQSAGATTPAQAAPAHPDNAPFHGPAEPPIADLAQPDAFRTTSASLNDAGSDSTATPTFGDQSEQDTVSDSAR